MLCYVPEGGRPGCDCGGVVGGRGVWFLGGGGEGWWVGGWRGGGRGEGIGFGGCVCEGGWFGDGRWWLGVCGWCLEVGCLGVRGGDERRRWVVG